MPVVSKEEISPPQLAAYLAFSRLVDVSMMTISLTLTIMKATTTTTTMASLMMIPMIAGVRAVWFHVLSSSTRATDVRDPAGGQGEPP